MTAESFPESKARMLLPEGRWGGGVGFWGCIIAQVVTTFFRWLMLRIARLLYLFLFYS